MKNSKGGKRGYVAGRRKIPVDQYSLMGEFMASFASMKEAARQTKTHEPSISVCVKTNRRNKRAGKYIWMLKGLKPSLKQLKNIHKNRVLSVYQYSLDGFLVSKYSSQTEAAQQTNMSISNVSLCIAGKTMTSGGYIWTNGSVPTNEQLRAIDDKYLTRSKPVYQYDLDGNFIAKYKSQCEAARMIRAWQGIKIWQPSISACILGKIQSTGEFIFKQ